MSWKKVDDKNHDLDRDQRNDHGRDDDDKTNLRQHMS